MKKLFLICLGLFLSIPAWADVTWHNVREASIFWEDTNVDVDGDPLFSDIWFEVFIADHQLGKDGKVLVLTTDQLEGVVEIPAKGIWYVGVRAVNDFGVSIINWADEPENQEGYDLFGLRWGAPPKAPPGVSK